MSYAVKLKPNAPQVVNTANGSTVRMVGGSFTQAIIQGDHLHLTQQDGRVRVVDIRNGSTIRLF